MHIGSRIRTARKSAGITQEELARRADMSLKGMGDIERGDIDDPHYSSLKKIADGLGMPVSELLEEPVLAGKDEASQPAGPLSPEWALRVNSDLLRATIRGATSAELRKLGVDLSREFFRLRTRDKTLEDGPDVVRRVRAFSLASVVNEELVRRGEKPLREYAAAFRRFENAMSGGEEAFVPEEEDQEHQAG